MRYFTTILLFISSLSIISQTCTTLVAYDHIETNTWAGDWFGSTLNIDYRTEAFISSTTSAVLYGSGLGTSATEEDWYVLPNITGLNTSLTYQLRFRLGSYFFTNPTSASKGVDVPDLVEVQLSTNGEISYTPEIRITGNNNANWNYNTNGVINKVANGILSTYSPAGGGDRTTIGDGYSLISLSITGVSQIAIDIRCRVNSIGEEWWLDNIELYEICNVILPIELVDFSIVSLGKYNKLNWKTITEINNNYFNIERSTDGVDWISIGRISGNGNSVQLSNYEFKDYDFSKNVINYYRLKQVDFDGRFEYSQIVYIENKSENKLIRTISIDGKEVDINYKGFVIDIYDNETYQKRIQLED